MVQGAEVIKGGTGLKSGKEVRELNKTKQGVVREYIGRTRRVWESGINMGMKAQAQNSWANAVMRFSLGTIGWCRSDVQEMDRATRRIMRQNKAHQYGASVARLYQLRANEGRGLVSLEQAWETETVASVLYLHSNQDPQVHGATRYLEQYAASGKKGLVWRAMEIGEKYEVIDLLQETEETDQPQCTRSFMKNIRTKQRTGLRDVRMGKVIHGVFAAEVEKKGCDRVATCAWLVSGKFRAETEGLMVAAQDGALHTAAFCHSIIKDGSDPTCMECGLSIETVGHILSACPGYQWSLYKNRHDAALDILVGAVAKRLGVRIPRNRWARDGTVKSAVYEENNATIMVDQCLPTKSQLTARRPDLVVREIGKRRITIIELACAWEPLVEAREAQKTAKYRELAADLAHQWPNFTVKNFPVVVGTMGLICGMQKALRGTGLWDEETLRALAKNLQTSVMNGSTRILRRHFKVHHERQGR